MKSDKHKTVTEYKQIAGELADCTLFSHKDRLQLLALSKKRTLTLVEKIYVGLCEKEVA